MGKKKGGWGVTYHEVYLLENLTIEAKAIYGALCSFAGVGATAYPSIDYLCRILCVSEKRLLKHMNLLIGAGIVKKERAKDKFGRPANNIYTLVPNLQFGSSQIGGVQKEGVYFGGVQGVGINNNTLNNNTLNNTKGNKKDVEYQEIVNLYNDTCVSFPKALALSESRKKAIKKALKTYSLEDFKKLFEMAEGSRFLKGCNDRNWSANFDWLIKDSNMAKVLEGNYEDRTGSKPKQTGTGNIFFDMLQEEEEKAKNEQGRNT